MQVEIYNYKWDHLDHTSLITMGPSLPKPYPVIDPSPSSACHRNEPDRPYFMVDAYSSHYHMIESLFIIDPVAPTYPITLPTSPPTTTSRGYHSKAASPDFGWRGGKE